MTVHRKGKAAEPGTARQPAATPSTPEFRLSEEDRLELWDHDDLRPDYPDRNWLPGPPTSVIVVWASDWVKEHFPAAAANLTDALRAGKDRHRDPEPDLEAEP
jgi:hypothetical protein